MCCLSRCLKINSWQHHTVLKKTNQNTNPQKSKCTALINSKSLKGRAELTPFTPVNASQPVERGEEKGKELFPLDWIIRILHFISRCKTEVGGYCISMFSKAHHLRSKMAFFSCLVQFATDTRVFFSSYLPPNPDQHCNCWPGCCLARTLFIRGSVRDLWNEGWLIFPFSQVVALCCL